MLNDLASQLSKLVRIHTPFLNDAALDEMLKELGKILIGADVNVQLVVKLRTSIKKQCVGEKIDRKLVMNCLCQSLIELLDGNGKNKKNWEPSKKRNSVVVFVGLQGAGKTTTIMKYAYYYKQRGFKVGLVACDTFRAGAFDQLQQNAKKIKVPFYGSYDESDPAVIAREGINKFRQHGFELILVDTAGRHKQEESLFDEMKEIIDVANPHHTIFVMDGTIGQQAFHQAKAFKDAVDVGSVILTKLDGSKGGGALSAVAATKSPIIFVGTGEHYHQFEKFDATRFVGKIMGQGDLQGLIEHAQSMHNQPSIERMQQGKYCLRDLFEQIKMMQSMGSMSSMMSMLPGMPQEMMTEEMDKEGGVFMRRMTAVLYSMTEIELDSNGKCFEDNSYIRRVALGAGVHPIEVRRVLAMQDQFSGMVKQLGGKNGLMANMARNNPQMQNAMQQGHQPNLQEMMQSGGMADMMKSMMGNGGMAEMMKSMVSGGGMPDLSQMMANMGGMAQQGQGQRQPKKVIVRKKR
eukprot:NODE_163_length_16507_cov_1.031814.p2 type:complete len:519 gc:universal NODE_163_length_16507_cov_1.031814:14824-13268(-)